MQQERFVKGVADDRTSFEYFAYIIPSDMYL